MIAYLTKKDTRFAVALAQALQRRGFEVYAGDELYSMHKPIDLFIATANEAAPGDDFSIEDGIDADVIMAAVQENVCDPVKKLEAALPMMDSAQLKRICFLTTHHASVNQSESVRGYGLNMSKAAAHQMLTIIKNKLQKDGYTFRVFDPLLDEQDKRVTIESAAEAAVSYCMTKRAADPDNLSIRNDERRMVMRDALGREWPW